MKNLALVLAIIFIILAVTVALGLSSAAPILGMNGEHHTKHAVLYAVLAVLSLVWYRFQSNAKA